MSAGACLHAGQIYTDDEAAPDLEMIPVSERDLAARAGPFAQVKAFLVRPSTALTSMLGIGARFAARNLLEVG